jgi:hypothetical protein
MGADSFVMTGRILPASSPVTVTEVEIRRRFHDEYSILGSNIRNLFEGIRMGSVNPVQAPAFVEEVVELAEQGRDRLITALVDRDEDLLHSVAVFGNFLQVDEKPGLDRDGILRRVRPVNEESIEHPVYSYLKSRYAVSQIESSDKRRILWLRDHDARDTDIILDREGNIITAGISAIRRIDIGVFREYERAAAAMLYALTEANELRAFSHTSPDRIPLFIGERSHLLLAELLKSPNNENRQAWITSRADYFKSLEEYFSSSAEAFLVSMYEEQIADTDPSNEESLRILIERRDDLVRLFESMRGIYGELSALHSRLKNELEFSLCIIGPQPNTDYSALLANVMITGSFIKPAYDSSVFLWTIFTVFVVLMIIFSLRPFILLPAGIILSVLSAIVYGIFFILYSYWIDPIIASSSILCGTIIIFFIKCAYLNYRARSFRMAYRTAVSKDALKNLIIKGRPRLSEISVSYAAVIAIKDINLTGKEENEKLQDGGKAKRAFYSMARKALFNSGAVIAGYEGDTVLACFGSSLETQPSLTTYKWTDDGLPLAKSYHPVDKACVLVRQLLKNEKISWHFSIDAGECSFSWSPETGFSVNGQPAVRVRMLVSKTAQYKARTLITKSVMEKIHMNGEKAKAFNDGNDSFFELPL